MLKENRKNISVTINIQYLEYINTLGNNRSDIINKALRKYLKDLEEDKLMQAYLDDYNDNLEFAQDALLIYNK